MKRNHGAGSIIRKGRQYYQRVTVPGRGRIDRPIIDPDTGERPETKSQAVLIVSRMTAPAKLVLTHLYDLDQMYLRAFPNRLTPLSQINRRTCMERFCSRWPLINQITHEALGQYVQERLATPTRHGKKRSTANVNRELAFLRRVLTWAEATGKIERSPFRGFHLLKEPPARDRILSKDEILRLLSTLGEERFAPIRLPVLIGLHCGLRWGEIATLKWEDLQGNEVDLERETFNLRVTKRGGRRVPIPQALLEALRNHPRVSEWVFPSPQNPAAHIGSIKKAFAATLQKADIRQFRFHDLRHTAASWMLLDIDVYTVKEILGHASIKTTERYLTAFEENKKKAVEWLK